VIANRLDEQAIETSSENEKRTGVQRMARMGIFESSRSVRRALGCALVGVALAGTVATASRAAEDATATMRDLAESSDFRVRVSAALLLGHTRPDGAREALEDALADGHPAVRVAAARALGSLGDPAALAALQRHLGQDASPSVTAQLRVAIAQLRRAAGSDDSTVEARRLAPGVRYVVELGTMRNHSVVAGPRSEELEQVMSDAARARAQQMRGTVFVDGDEAVRQQAAARHVPVMTLDGNITQVAEARVGGGMQVQVRVEFAIRRGQTLRGTVSGAATTFGPGSEITDEGRRKLQEDALTAAVQSALRGAEDGLVVAAR
jgi:HEAT repeats